MRLGILADIHEQVEELRNAIAVLQNEDADRFVILGDVFETGQQIEETVQLLQDVDAAGVWGNHDFGLCSDPSEQIRNRFSTQVLDFMGRLKPRLEIDGCLFTHLEPWLDPQKIEDLWYFDGPRTHQISWPGAFRQSRTGYFSSATCTDGFLAPLAASCPGVEKSQSTSTTMTDTSS